MNPPPAQPFASRIFLGPALRTQSDGRLVKLVREGYDGAFEEIVRRYRKPLDRFAAGFVGNRSEDVTQDALSKALLALRGSETEIELRPWLYRIVRNTALNDIRDRPPTVEQLEETLAGGESAAVAAERREEMGELIERLRALPEPQRAAIVMRELEGLSHEEIAAALGISGGGARQAIYRARAALRDGLGLLVPLPLLRLLFEQGAAADAATGAAAAAGAAAGAAGAGGGGATLGGIGAGTALKAGLATVLVAGSVGAAGVAIENQRSGNRGPEPAEAAVSSATPENAADASDPGSSTGGSAGPGSGEEAEPSDDDRGRHGETEREDEREDGDGHGDEDREDHSGSGSRHGSSRSDDDDRSGSSSGGGRSGSGKSGSGASGSGSSGSGSGRSGGDDDSHGFADDGDSHSGSDSGDEDPVASPPTAAPTEADDDDNGSDSSGSESSGSSGSDSDDD